jgi:predicted HAD superfamily Cof-like phosphohydrolase
MEAYYDGDLVGVTDALIDLMYFTLGFMWQMKIPIDKAWAIVHAANMQKVRGKTKRGVDGDAAKPEGWISPEEQLRELLK